MKRRFLGVFICLLSVFLMSHNTFALDLSTDVVFQAHLDSPQIYPLTWNNLDGSCTGLQEAWTNSVSCFQGGLISYRHKIPSRSYSSGEIIRLSYNVSIFNEGAANHSTFGGLKYIGNHPVHHLYDEVQQLNDSTGLVYSYFWVYGSFSDSDLQISSQDGGFSWFLRSPNTSGNKPKLIPIDTMVFSLKTATDYSSALSSLATQSQAINGRLDALGDKIIGTNNRLDDLNDTISEQNEKENQSIDNIDNQSTSDIQGTDNVNTTSLIGLFSSFVSALSSASATNCNIDGDMGNIDLGTLNLCRDNPPAIVQIIGSIFLIVLFVPLAYFLVKRIISEIRSFTNG